MRVIAGSARRLPLKTLEGLDIRPTTDRIKETLFNMINDRIYDSRFLDLFSGSGSIGIEALSRGAEVCYFVDSNRDAIACIKENLRFTKLEDDAVVWNKDVISSIKELTGKGRSFSVVFMDPPYRIGIEEEVLKCLVQSDIIDEDTLIIAESLKDTKFNFLDSIGLSLIKEKIYKTNKHVFMCLARR
jgi:16S rRNA (guanine966-N2)-methyltransferase